MAIFYFVDEGRGISVTQKIGASKLSHRTILVIGGSRQVKEKHDNNEEIGKNATRIVVIRDFCSNYSS